MSAALVLNPVTVRELVDSIDAEFAMELMDAFLKDSPRLVADIRQGLGEGDAELVRRSAHTLKSNGWTFGLEQLAPLCQELEDLAGAEGVAGAEPLAREVEASYAVARGAVEAARDGLSEGQPPG
ncbi:Hpt domain-containing protein [Streptomyces sp. NPDC001594]|uniref:Hpt domain-containing protein n=1 Tax=Streptomyces sp. NPDC001594 TaxID=3364590 RepID=UPI0036B8745E